MLPLLSPSSYSPSFAFLLLPPSSATPRAEKLAQSHHQRTPTVDEHDGDPERKSTRRDSPSGGDLPLRTATPSSCRIHPFRGGFMDCVKILAFFISVAADSGREGFLPSLHLHLVVCIFIQARRLSDLIFFIVSRSFSAYNSPLSCALQVCLFPILSFDNFDDASKFFEAPSPSSRASSRNQNWSPPRSCYTYLAFPQNLFYLDTESCWEIKTSIDLSNLKAPSDLEVAHCLKVREFRGLQVLENSSAFKLQGAPSMDKLPDLTSLEKLQKFYLQ